MDPSTYRTPGIIQASRSLLMFSSSITSDQRPASLRPESAEWVEPQIRSHLQMAFTWALETWSGERSAELVSTSETRNPKPETRNRLWRLNFPRTDRNPKPEARKPETDSEDLPSPGPIETRNPKPTLKTYLPQDRSKPETRNRLWRLNFPRADRNPKPETNSEDLPSPGPIEIRNPKPETDSEDLPSPGPIETRNPKATLKTYLPQDRSKPETRNPKPETDSEDLPSPGPIETRNPKPTLKTYLPQDRSKPETRNPKPTLKTYRPQDRSKPETRNPKPETDSNPTFGWLSGSELGLSQIPWTKDGQIPPALFILSSPPPARKFAGTPGISLVKWP